MSNIFDGVETITVSGPRAEFAQPGTYNVRINSVNSKTSRKGQEYIEIAMQVVNTIDGSMTEGSECVHFFWRQHDSFLGSIKKFIMAATGCSAEEVTKDACELVISEEQPLSGTVIEAVFAVVDTRSGGKFTTVSFAPAKS